MSKIQFGVKPDIFKFAEMVLQIVFCTEFAQPKVLDVS